MGYYHLQRGWILNSKSFLKLLIPLLLAVLFVFATKSVGAQDTQPVDNINPSHSEPAIGYLPEDTSINSNDNDLIDISNEKCTSQPSWWNWLVSASNKPANFHYIDIIELLN